ncbi:MAG: hypothetical protein PHQ23_17150, partial [Candidatus Wallbacteria bacterium]|nr:hypothetical protein [Candidatus Wallbacteria bacterium]
LNMCFYFPSKSAYIKPELVMPGTPVYDTKTLVFVRQFISDRFVHERLQSREKIGLLDNRLAVEEAHADSVMEQFAGDYGVNLSAEGRMALDQEYLKYKNEIDSRISKLKAELMREKEDLDQRYFLSTEKASEMEKKVKEDILAAVSEIKKKLRMKSVIYYNLERPEESKNQGSSSGLSHKFVSIDSKGIACQQACAQETRLNGLMVQNTSLLDMCATDISGFNENDRLRFSGFLDNRTSRYPGFIMKRENFFVLGGVDVTKDALSIVFKKYKISRDLELIIESVISGGNLK